MVTEERTSCNLIALVLLGLPAACLTILALGYWGRMLQELVAGDSSNPKAGLIFNVVLGLVPLVAAAVLIVVTRRRGWPWPQALLVAAALASVLGIYPAALMLLAV